VRESTSSESVFCDVLDHVAVDAGWEERSVQRSSILDSGVLLSRTEAVGVYGEIFFGFVCHPRAIA